MNPRGDDPLSASSEHEIELPPGYRVGEYEIVEKIGQGGFGAVFKAVHPLIGKVAAVKVLSQTYSNQPHMVSRFMAEARAANQIQHRNIIDIFAFGTLENNLQYYIMEYLEGESLEQYIARRGRLDVAETLVIVAPIARALQAAHDKGIAHRDLKADNIFLSQDREGQVTPKLLDFGVAKLLNSDQRVAHRTREGAPIGTPGYMSPEQALGQAVDHRTDIYAFGILLFRMLTGVMPFRDDSYMQVLFKHIHEAPPKPRSLAPELPEGVEQSILAMLQKSPEARPGDMLTALRRLDSAARAAGIELPADLAQITLPVRVENSGRLTPPVQNASGDMGAQDTVDAGLGNAATLESGAPPSAAAAPTSPAVPWPSPAIAVTSLPAAADVATIRAASPPKSRRALLGGGIALSVGAVALAVALMSGSTTTAQRGDVAAPTRERLTGQPEFPVTAPQPPGPAQPEPKDRADPQALPGSSSGTPLPAAPTPVTITITGTPMGTEVYGPSGLIGTAPGPIQLVHSDQEVSLTFQAEGYETKTAAVTPSADRALEVSMTPKPKQTRVPRPSAKPAGGKKDKRDALESPF